MKRCVECGNWRLKDAKQMAKFGFGTCSLEQPWIFKAPNATCERHKQAAADVTAARVQWLAKLAPSK